MARRSLKVEDGTVTGRFFLHPRSLDGIVNRITEAISEQGWEWFQEQKVSELWNQKKGSISDPTGHDIIYRHLMNEPKSDSFRYVVSQVAAFENRALLEEKPERTQWIYTLFSKWRRSPFLPEHFQRSVYKLEEVYNHHAQEDGPSRGMDDRLRLIIHEYNLSLLKAHNDNIGPPINEGRSLHESDSLDLGEIADNLSQYDEETHDRAYEIAMRFTDKDPVGTFSDLHRCIGRLNKHTNDIFFDTVYDAIQGMRVQSGDDDPEQKTTVEGTVYSVIKDEVDHDRNDKIYSSIKHLLINVADAYKNCKAPDIDRFVDELPVHVHASGNTLKRLDDLNGELMMFMAEAEAKIPPMARVNQLERRLIMNFKEEFPPFLEEKCKDIKRNVGLQGVMKFQQKMDVFQEMEFSPWEMFAIAGQLSAYIINPEINHGNIGAMLLSANEYEKSKEKHKSDLESITCEKCPQDIRKGFKKLGLEPARDLVIYDVTRFQDRAYFGREPTREYISLVERRIDNEMYAAMTNGMHNNNLLDSSITLVGLGGADAKKEIFIWKHLRNLNYDVDLVLLDGSMPMRQRAAELCERNYVDQYRIIDADIENLHPGDFKFIDRDRQMLMLCLGGTSFNFHNPWEFHRNNREIFRQKVLESRLGPQDFQPLNWWKMLCQGQSEKDGLSYYLPSSRQDIFVTEGHKSKDMSHYDSDESIQFLSLGLGEQARIPLDAIMIQDGPYKGKPARVVVGKKTGLKFAYLLTKDAGNFKKGEALLVMQSRKLDNKFEYHMKGIGFSCREMSEGVYGDTLVISSLCAQDKKAKKDVYKLIQQSKI